MLLLTGPVVLWRSRCTGGRHALRRTVTRFVAVIVALGVVWFVVFPVGVAYVYTHTGRTPTTPDVGLPVAVTTTDALDLSAWYVPSQNRPR